MFRPSCLNLQGPAKIAPFPGFKTARPNADSFSIKYKRKPRTVRQPDADTPAFTPNSSLLICPNPLTTDIQKELSCRTNASNA